MNWEMATVTYLFMLLFVLMAGYVIWFLSGDTDLILNNPQNKRQDLLAERVKKGSILSDRGKVLAETVTRHGAIRTAGCSPTRSAARLRAGQAWKHPRVIRCSRRQFIR